MIIRYNTSRNEFLWPFVVEKFNDSDFTAAYQIFIHAPKCIVSNQIKIFHLKILSTLQKRSSAPNQKFKACDIQEL